MADLIVIDGSQGEGGGQVLRTSLTLSLLTGQPFRIENVRGRRKKPGLLRQHLTAVRAATDISSATVEGDELGSATLTFRPNKLRGGTYNIAIGSAGSACLVLQTILPALALTSEPSVITIEGGTHNPLAPTFDYLHQSFIPIVNRMGAFIDVQLHRHGFYPAGGGRITARVTPARRFEPLELLQRGEIRSRKARVFLAHLPRSIAERELAIVAKRLTWHVESHTIEDCNQSVGPGNVLSLEIACDNLTEIFTGFGERDLSAEHVAETATAEARDWLASGAPVGPHLADQLLIPFALAGSGRFTTMPLSKHTTTSIDVLRRFLPIDIHTQPAEGRNITIAFAAR